MSRPHAGMHHRLLRWLDEHGIEHREGYVRADADGRTWRAVEVRVR